MTQERPAVIVVYAIVMIAVVIIGASSSSPHHQMDKAFWDCQSLAEVEAQQMPEPRRYAFLLSEDGLTGQCVVYTEGR